MAYTTDLKSVSERIEGSNPSSPTKLDYAEGAYQVCDHPDCEQEAVAKHVNGYHVCSDHVWHITTTDNGGG